MLQLRINQWSWYGKLLRHLTKNHNKDDELKKAFLRVKEIADEVFSDVKQKISNGSFNAAFPGTEILFQFSADEKPDIYKNVVIYIDDGYKSLITDKGSGIQSATIIGLFSYYINYVNTKSSALLCLEEPELYLHPHACRVWTTGKRYFDMAEYWEWKANTEKQQKEVNNADTQVNVA